MQQAPTPSPTLTSESAGSGVRVRWAGLGLSLAMLAHHFGLWAWTAYSRGFPLLDGLNRWDSAHYSTLVTRGYVDPLWAFLPLYPAVVRAVWTALGSAIPVQLVGAAISTVMLLAFVAWVSRREADAVVDAEPGPLWPRTAWGWFLFLFSPASFALHSHHTEALFLLLSFGALLLAWDGRVLGAAVFVALCVWTRNQGLFVALSAGLLLASHGQSWRGRAGRLAAVGCAAIGSYAGLLGFEWSMAGDPLAHLHAQRSWNHADSVWSAIRGLWFGNPWHKPGVWLALRNVFAAVLLAGTLAMFRRNRAVALYGLLSLAVMLPQGDLGNAFRFGAVLFPILFWLGDWLAQRPLWARCVAALLVVWLNHKVSHFFIIGNWAY